MSLRERVLQSRLARVLGAIAAVLVLGYMVVLPWLPETNDGTLLTMTLMLTSVALAINWNLTGGFTGYVDFGHAVWFGTGAYATAILMSPESDWIPQQVPLVPAVIAGALTAGLLANLVGRMTLRLSGAYFSIAMLGFFFFVKEIVRVVRPLSNGGTGLFIKPNQNAPLWYGIELGLVVLLLLLSWWLRRTQFGSSLVAIREDETGAEMRGIDTTRNKVWIFTLSAMSTGLFGGIWFYQKVAIEPDTGFVEVFTIDAVMGTMLGGLGTVLGPVIGMVSLFWLRELVWANLLEAHQLAQGLILGFIVLFLPKGIVGLFGGESRSVWSLLRSLGLDGGQSSTFDGMETALSDEELLEEERVS